MNQTDDFAGGQRPILELQVDDNRVPLRGSLTIGRHLDNDLIVAGEDVLDYHTRVALSARAVTLHPLQDATIVVNDVTCDQAIGIVPGDQVRIGASWVSVIVGGDDTPTESSWFLHHDRGPDAIRLQSTQVIGRDEDADIQIAEHHISRAHARIIVDRYVWISDLGSANGTFVNNERIVGGVRLFHGDYVSFDSVRYQLVGSGPDLTPVRLEDDSAVAPIDTLDAPEIRSDTTLVGVVDVDAQVQAPIIVSDMHLVDDAGAGAALVGASEPIVGDIHRTKIGRGIIGRSASCDIIIEDQTVSLQHAELVTRAEGCTLTNLMATNGTHVNGEPIHSQQLRDGDIVRLGQVSLVYREVPSAAPAASRNQWLLTFLGAAIVAAAAWLLLLD